MEKILVVASSGAASDSLTGFLNEAGYSDTSGCHSAEDAKKRTAAENFDIIVVNTPLSDQTGGELCGWLASSTLSGIVMIVREEELNGIFDRMSGMGVFVLSKPFAKQNFIRLIKTVAVSNARVRNVSEQNRTLTRKIEDINLVNRAKKVLTGRLGMSEDQAHHYIEHQAMDRRKSKREIAELIIRTYEN